MLRAPGSMPMTGEHNKLQMNWVAREIWSYKEIVRDKRAAKHLNDIAMTPFVPFIDDESSIELTNSKRLSTLAIWYWDMYRRFHWIHQIVRYIFLHKREPNRAE